MKKKTPKQPDSPVSCVDATVASQPVGRPLVISTDEQWSAFDSLVQMHCTEQEIAYFFKCSIDTVSRACMAKFGMHFADYFKANAVGGRMSLRRQLWQNALGDKDAGVKPHAATAIFLSKQREERGGLGFSDKVSNELGLGDGAYEDMMGFVQRMEKEKAEES